MNRAPSAIFGWLLAAAAVVMPLLFFSLKMGLDGYQLPKELLLHAAAVGALLFVLLGRRRRWSGGRGELLLAGYVALSAVSAMVASQNGWWALRSFGLHFSGVVLFCSARRVLSPRERPLILGALGAGCALVALTMLLEAHGLLPKISMPGRAPGATVGHRNFAAHLLVLGVPVLAMLALACRSRAPRIACSVGLTLTVAAIVISRSRAALLGLALVITIGALLILVRRLVSPGRTIPLVLGAMVGLAVSGQEPSALVWADKGAALSTTLSRIVEVDQGSGRGRLIQYRTTVKMIMERPLLGTGPGNWSVRYPDHAAPDDPSISPLAIQPVNFLPNSDWLGIGAERGLPALLTLLVAMLGALSIALRTVLQTSGPQAARLSAATLILLAVASLALGSVDAVLLRPEPVLLVALAAAALLPTENLEPRPALHWSARMGLLVPGLALGMALVSFTALRMRAGQLATRGDLPEQREALALDPGNYQLASRLAMAEARRARCHEAGQYVERVLTLYPHSPVATVVGSYCPSVAHLRVGAMVSH